MTMPRIADGHYEQEGMRHERGWPVSRDYDQNEIEVTPAMTLAGMGAYYSIPRYRGDEPITDDMVTLIYRAMRQMALPDQK